MQRRRTAERGRKEFGMTERRELSREQAARQVREHLDSVARAGVEWLTRMPAPPVSEPLAVETTEAPVPTPASLFAGASPTDPSPAERRQQLTVLAEKV